MTDIDLPGDSNFRATPPVVVVPVDITGGTALAMAMTVSAAEQTNQHHNRLRYAELQNARAGRPNLYNESSYR